MDVLNGEYVEAVTTPSQIPRFLDGEYVEVATIPLVTPRIMTTFYIEVITSREAPSSEGWGIPID